MILYIYTQFKEDDFLNKKKLKDDNVININDFKLMKLTYSQLKINIDILMIM